ncbi:hypothetical protein EZV62_004519 [Acer yangbiense]|uniref:Uncharacterized protein n=1 Tax=Acer yangbiense TaxID=1000413 RepID=A0A5C7IL49_9ROSI|nr:hypothetical protein EZV62_004519 [Acer yangbiense]
MCSLMSWIQIWMIRQKTFQQRRGRVGSRVAVGLEKNDDLLTNSPIPSSKKGRGRLEDGVVGNAIFVHGRSIKSLNFSLSWISPVSVTGTAAGISSTLVCHPLEVLKDRLTVSRDVYPSLSIAISKIYKDGGIGAFYAGLSPTLIGMLPYSTCYYFMYKTMKKSYCKSKNKKSLNRPEMLMVGALAGLTASTISFPLEVARKRLMVGALKGKCPPHTEAALEEVIREEGVMGCKLFKSDAGLWHNLDVL